jgi:hypothetical protein
MEEQRAGCNDKKPLVFQFKTPQKTSRRTIHTKQERAARSSDLVAMQSTISRITSLPISTLDSAINFAPSKSASKSVNPARSFSPVFDTNAVDYDIPPLLTIPVLPLADAINSLKADKEKLRALVQSQTQALISMDRSMLALRRQVASSQANVSESKPN